MDKPHIRAKNGPINIIQKLDGQPTVVEFNITGLTEVVDPPWNWGLRILRDEEIGVQPSFSFEVSDGVLYWTVETEQMERLGMGQIQISLTNGEATKMSRIYYFYISPQLH